MTNDRITELAEQAGFKTRGSTIITMHSSGAWVGINDELQRFSALVRNDVLEDAAAACQSWGSPSSKTYLGTACRAAASRITGMKS